MRRRLPAVGLALALSLGGCASYSPHHGARLTPPHTTERTLSADALVKYCEDIAAASGGLLGIGKVSSEERKLLSSIAAELKSGRR